MPFQLMGVTSVYKKGKVLKHKILYQGYGGRFSIIIDGTPETTRHISIKTDTHNFPFAALLCPKIDHKGDIIVNVILPHQKWAVDLMDAMDWNLVTQETEIAITAAREIEAGFALYRKEYQQS